MYYTTQLKKKQCWCDREKLLHKKRCFKVITMYPKRVCPTPKSLFIEIMYSVIELNVYLQWSYLKKKVQVTLAQRFLVLPRGKNPTFTKMYIRSYENQMRRRVLWTNVNYDVKDARSAFNSIATTRSTASGHLQV